MEVENMIYIYTDGGSRGNPGPAATGVYIIDSKNGVLHKGGKFIGEATNNVAEYSALIQALSWLAKNKNKIGDTTLHFRLDSLLIVNQIKGLYKIKHIRLQQLIVKVRVLMKELSLPIHFEYIPREKNKIADSLVNQALDKKRL